MKIVFFAGKGGVGKSTNAAVFAYKRAKEGSRVLLNSIDPAHNLHDIFKKSFSQKAAELIPGLLVMETDLKIWVKRYLSDMENEFKNVYKYLEAFNLHKYFKILKYSPGIEEYAVLLAMEDAIRSYADVDFLVFDTPPTALTLRFLALPKVSLLWLRELSSLRKQILEKKEIISRIKENGKSKETDPVMNRIENLIKRYHNLEMLLSDHKTTAVVIVLNHDSLSLSESIDIHKELTSLDINIPRIILNKFDGGTEYSETLRTHFKGAAIDVFPLLTKEVTGLDCISSLLYPIPIHEYKR